ncbi:MAG: ketoacyl-ACP synthase III [Crocinitomicaceae bacterium]|nr:ketoacyl-ACP synthase III [Crocinitomicaceae bacterium]
MAVFSISNTKIVGVSAAIPKKEASNLDLMGMSEQEIQLLIKTTGIDKRRIANEETSASDLCLKAAEKLLDDLKWQKEEIEILIFVSQTPDYQIPGTSMILQQKLGLPNTCMALDINQGCAGYVVGLATMTSMMSASQLKKGLLLVGDTITQLLQEGDNSTVPIFSDAGSATAIEFDANAEDMHFNLQTDGSKYDAIIMEKGGHMKMRGHDIFTFGLKEVSPNLERLFEHSQRSKEEVDHFVFHQANKLLNESIRKKMDIPSEKVPMTLHKYGNTSCATIPLTIVSELQQEVQQKNVNLVLSGFGVGLSWGSAFVNISDIQCPKLIEI